MSGRRFARPQRPPAPLRPDRRRVWPALVALLPVAAWVGWRLYDDRQVDAAPARPALVSFDEPSGDRTTAARCWMVAIDDSASMATADSAGTRGDAVLATNEFLAAYGLDDDRIGVTWFADTADVYAPEQVDVAAPPNRPTREIGSGTRIADSLGAAFTAMDGACADTERVAVLVSDGQANGLGEYRAVADALAAHDVALHLVAMNGDGAFDAVRSQWDDAVPLRSVREIDSFGRADVATAVAGILSQETGQEVTAR